MPGRPSASQLLAADNDRLQTMEERSRELESRQVNARRTGHRAQSPGPRAAAAAGVAGFVRRHNAPNNSLRSRRPRARSTSKLRSRRARGGTRTDAGRIGSSTRGPRRTRRHVPRSTGNTRRGTSGNRRGAGSDRGRTKFGRRREALASEHVVHRRTRVVPTRTRGVRGRTGCLQRTSERPLVFASGRSAPRIKLTSNNSSKPNAPPGNANEPVSKNSGGCWPRSATIWRRRIEAARANWRSPARRRAPRSNATSCNRSSTWRSRTSSASHAASPSWSRTSPAGRPRVKRDSSGTGTFAGRTRRAGRADSRAGDNNAARAASGNLGTIESELQRRFELAVEDVRDLKKRNAELETEVGAAAKVARRSRRSVGRRQQLGSDEKEDARQPRRRGRTTSTTTRQEERERFRTRSAPPTSPGAQRTRKSPNSNTQLTEGTTAMADAEDRCASWSTPTR